MCVWAPDTRLHVFSPPCFIKDRAIGMNIDVRLSVMDVLWLNGAK